MISIRTRRLNSPAPRRSKCSISGVAAGTVLALLTAPTPLPAAAALTFEAPYRAYDTGPSCYDLAVGDLNGDGHPDVGTANTGSASVTLYLTGPDGAFGPRTDFGMSSLPNSSIAFGDINGDGLMDLLATKANSAGGVYYRMNMGNGTFAGVQAVADANQPRAVRVTDLNGDGIADLVAPAMFVSGPFFEGNLDSWLGVGNGQFGPRISQHVGITFRNILGLHLGDYNHDTHMDLLIAQTFSPDLAFLGQGDGSLSSGTMLTGTWVEGGATADVTGDGNEDFITTDTATIKTYRGVGDGTFALAVSTPATSPGLALALGDFNGDGVSDLLTSTQCLLGAGGGAFQPQLSLGSLTFERAATGDFDGDGRLDVVATTGGRALYRLDGNGDGTFGTWRHETTAGITSRAALGDFNGDGRMDAAVAIDRLTSLPGLVEVRLGHADGTYDPAVSYITAVGACAIVAADFDGDGIMDLATGSRYGSGSANRLSLLQGVGDGTFLPAQYYSADIVVSELLVADLNGDSHPDLLATSGNGGLNSTVHLNSGSGTFPGAGSLLSGAGHPAAVGDVDGDGDLDIVLLNYSLQNARYFRNNGIGNFSAEGSSPTLGSPFGVSLGDFNEDGHADLAVLNVSTPVTGVSYAVSLHRGIGEGSFTQVAYSAVAGEPRDLTLADFDADGHLDVATAAVTTRAVTILAGDGQGGLPRRDDFGTMGCATGLAARDLNGDGRLDLLATTYSPDGFTILRQPTAISAAPEPPPPGLALRPAYPNPMTSATTIAFTLAVAGPVRVQIFDVRGRLVSRLAERQFGIGAHAIAWNGATDGGAQAPSGLYFYALEFAGRRFTRTLTLVR